MGLGKNIELNVLQIKVNKFNFTENTNEDLSTVNLLNKKNWNIIETSKKKQLIGNPGSLTHSIEYFKDNYTNKKANNINQ